MQQQSAETTLYIVTLYTYCWNTKDNTFTKLNNTDYSSTDVTSEFDSDGNRIVNCESSIVVSSGVNSATLTLKDSTINSESYYAVSTNAAVPTSGAEVVVNIENSTLTTTDKHDNNYDSAAILFNIPGTLNITGSTLTGERQGCALRHCKYL